MKKNMIRAAAAGVLLYSATAAEWAIFRGFADGRGPFARLHDQKTSLLPGNRRKYNPGSIKERAESPLKGKRLFFLGSSVTYGAASQGISFVEDLAGHTGCRAVKEAGSVTTLVDDGEESYIARMKRNRAKQVDLFICQLSTNDATQKKPLGTVGISENLEDFDTHTVAGAIEYIICYAKKRWGCPVMFYTNPAYDSPEYGRMVRLLKEIQKEWKIGVIDLWDNASFNRISRRERALYMADPIHPTKAGYLKWWLPCMEPQIEKVFRDARGDV